MDKTRIGQTRPEQLQRLRELILAADQTRVAELEHELRELRARIDDTDNWLEQLDPVIAAAIANKISDSKEEMAMALAPVMGPALKRQIDEAKDDIADALYPVIGRTIRKSIAESMKQLVKTVNEKLDRALSFQSILRRVKSKVSGIPEGELALKDALPFEVLEVFLIHKQNGVLLSHVSNQQNGSQTDQEIISGMLTAIRDFAKTAFEPGQTRELSQIEYDDLQIYIEDGRYSYLAVVCTGVAPEQFSALLKLTERKIHNQFYKVLRNYDGNPDPLKRCEPTLARLLHNDASPAKRPKPEQQASLWPAMAFILFIIALVAAGTYFAYSQKIWPFHATQQPPPRGVDTGMLASQVQERLDNELATNLSQLSYILDGNMLIVEGESASEQDRVIIGHAVARLAPGRSILNNLRVTAPPLSEARQRLSQIQIFFEREGTGIREQEHAKLDQVTEIIRQHRPDKIRLVGYADNSGTETENLTLSLKRAQAVRDFLAARGIKPELMQTEGQGSRNPLAPNTTEAGRQLNRRVEFFIGEGD